MNYPPVDDNPHISWSFRSTESAEAQAKAWPLIRLHHQAFATKDFLVALKTRKQLESLGWRLTDGDPLMKGYWHYDLYFTEDFKGDRL